MRGVSLENLALVTERSPTQGTMGSCVLKATKARYASMYIGVELSAGSKITIGSHL